MQEWLGDEGDKKLSDWDISRDAPYFGFPIPGTNGKKFFYVWLDAPVGYFGSFINYLKKTYITDHKKFAKDFLRSDEETELVHFIGKDILYFHALFWPAMLNFSEFRTPTKIYAHGFLTVNGQKMSKSRGTFITANSYITSGLKSEWLRYYYAAKLNASMEDIDLNLEDFMARVNSDLIGKFLNIASRSSNFITKYFEGKLILTSLANEVVIKQFVASSDDIAQSYENREYNKAIREIMRLADIANIYIDQHKPWELAKEPTKRNELHKVCSVSVNLFKILATYLKPVLPEIAIEVESFLKLPELNWEDSKKTLPGEHKIDKYRHLSNRIEPDLIDTLLNANKESNLKTTRPQPMTNSTENADTDESHEITIDTFAKIDLRVAKVLTATHVEGADKLIRLELDVGNERRQVFAGIKSAYNPDDLVDKLVVVVANLKSRKMRFGDSQGMVLAASGDDSEIFIISPDNGAKPGMQVK